MTMVGVVVAALSTLLICPRVIQWLERGAVLDVPVERSSHVHPVPRGGGLAPAIGACLGGLAVVSAGVRPVLAVLAVAAAYGLLGLREDLVGLPPLVRLAAQGAIGAVGTVALLLGEDIRPLLALAAVVTCLWLVGFVNVFNFMDGINGISGVQVAVAGAAWAAVGLWQDESGLVAVGAVVAAAAMAFLPFNFPSAKVFPGDVGSYFLGGWLAATVVVAARSGLTPEMALAPVLLYLADSGTTLLRRIRRRAPLLEAHREHVYQQLVLGGWSHAKTTATVGAAIVTCSLLGAVTMTGDTTARIAADGALVVVLLGYLLSPRLQGRPRVAGPAPVMPGDPR